MATINNVLNIVKHYIKSNITRQLKTVDYKYRQDRCLKTDVTLLNYSTTHTRTYINKGEMAWNRDLYELSAYYFTFA